MDTGTVLLIVYIAFISVHLLAPRSWHARSKYGRNR